MKTDIQRCLKWFDAYTRDFVDRAPKEILLTVQSKIAHTQRVLAHVRAILKNSAISETLCPVAEVAAILHDVGRFPQLVGTASFDDHVGYNHAEEGEKILRQSEVLGPFDDIFRKIVLTAVRLHNVGVLPDGLTKDEQLVLEILRDADKLDALRNSVKYMSPDTPYGKALKSGMTWSETEVSPEVVKQVLNRELVPFPSIKWSNDFVLFLTCWIYDLHFPYAYRHLDESGTFEGLLDFLPDTKPFDRIKKQLRGDLGRFIDRG